MNRHVITILVFLLLCHITYGQQKKISLLDEGFYFSPLVFDPTESLSSAGVFNLWEDTESLSGLYIPVNLALHHSLIRYQIDSLQGLEFGLQAAAFTQFEVNQVSDNVYLGGMINVDYRATGFISYYRKQLAVRLRLFHISSHLADDYIIRNEISTPTPNTLNYEQIDLTAAYELGPLRIYAGTGYIFTPNSIRKRLSFEAGGQFRELHRDEKFVRLIGGIDVKYFEENSYTPGIRMAAGVELGQARKPHVAFLLDFYNGHLPYSTLEYRRVTWLGISSVLIPKRILN